MTFTFFMKCRAATALNAGMVLHSMLHKRQKEGTVTFYCATVNYTLKM